MELSSQLATNAEDISGLFARMGNFEERLQKATASSPSTMSPAHTGLPALAHDFAEFKVMVWKTLAKLKTQTELLALGFDRHETFLRRKVLLLHGVPEAREEKVSEVVLDILTNNMKLPDLTLSDLQTCHRLGTSTAKPRSILVRFRDLEQRRLVWDTKTSLKESGIIISEFLTKTRHDVFMAARKHFGVKNCWTTDGRIIILLPDKTRKKVEVHSELRSIIALFPAARPVVPDPQKGTSRPAPLTKPVSRSLAGSSSTSRKLRGKPS